MLQNHTSNQWLDRFSVKIIDWIPIYCFDLFLIFCFIFILWIIWFFNWFLRFIFSSFKSLDFWLKGNSSIWNIICLSLRFRSFSFFSQINLSMRTLMWFLRCFLWRRFMLNFCSVEACNSFNEENEKRQQYPSIDCSFNNDHPRPVHSFNAKSVARRFASWYNFFLFNSLIHYDDWSFNRHRRVWNFQLAFFITSILWNQIWVIACLAYINHLITA